MYGQTLRVRPPNGRRVLRATLVGTRLILPGEAPGPPALLGAVASRTGPLRAEATVSGDGETLTARQELRLRPSEKREFQEEAELAGLSVSELIRRRALGRPVVASADRVMINELRRIGGLLKHVHVTSGGAYSKDTAAALVELKSVLTKLGEAAAARGGRGA